MGATTYGGLPGKRESILIKINLCRGGMGDERSGRGAEARVTDWIGAGDAARRLGIKPATLYSYVSRGVLRRRTGEDGRASLFDAGEVDALARRGRPRHPRAGEFVIESGLTEITSDRTCYRGLDITGRAAQAALPPGTLPLERFSVIVPALAAADPLRLQLDPPAVIAAARAIMAGLVDCLPAPEEGTGGDGNSGGDRGTGGDGDTGGDGN